MTVIDLSNEIWKDISGYEGLYRVSNLGRVKTMGRYYCSGENMLVKKYQPEMLMKTGLVSGYPTLRLCKNGVKKQFQIHRLLGLHFIPNPNSYPCINHKNSIREDFRLENLEWCTYSYNAEHGFRVGGRNIIKGDAHVNSISVIAINLKSGGERYFGSQREAGRELGIAQAQIHRVLKGIEKQAKGYKFIKADAKYTELV